MPSNITGARVVLNGTELTPDAMHSVVVEMDIDQPDMCTATLNNTPENGFSKNTNLGDTLEIKISETDSSDTTTLFKGEVVGVEPTWDTGGPSKVILRGLNKLHRMGATKKSTAFNNVSDQDIINKIVSQNSLTVDFGPTPPTLQYAAVYQHNQTDLEFMLMRAARIGYEVIVDGPKLNFHKRDLSKDSGIEIEYGNESADGQLSIQKLTVRMTGHGQVETVEIRGWDPKTKKEVVGTAAKGDLTLLGDKHGGAQAGAGLSPEPKHVEADVPVASVDEAKAIAKAKLDAMSLNFMTAEAHCKGSPKLIPGKVITIKKLTGTDTPDIRFCGKYYIVGAMHKAGGGGGGAYHTFLKLKRNAS